MPRYRNNHTWKRSAATVVNDSSFISQQTNSELCFATVPEPLPVRPSPVPVSAWPAPRHFTAHTRIPKKPKDSSLTLAPSLGVHGFLITCLDELNILQSLLCTAYDGRRTRTDGNRQLVTPQRTEHRHSRHQRGRRSPHSPRVPRCRGARRGHARGPAPPSTRPRHRCPPVCSRLPGGRHGDPRTAEQHTRGHVLPASRAGTSTQGQHRRKRGRRTSAISPGRCVGLSPLYSPQRMSRSRVRQLGRGTLMAMATVTLILVILKALCSLTAI